MLPWLAPKDVEALSFLWFFGGFIGNTDRHFGNISFMAPPAGLTLAPVYDMLPMLYAPQGPDLPDRSFAVPTPAGGDLAVWSRAGRAALMFWEQAASDVRISAAFRAIAAACERKVKEALVRLSADTPSRPST